MGMGFAPTWLRQVRPPLHMTTISTAQHISSSHQQPPLILAAVYSLLSLSVLSLDLLDIVQLPTIDDKVGRESE